MTPLTHTLSLVAVALSAFGAGVLWQRGKNNAELKKQINKLKASTDALGRALQQNQNQERTVKMSASTDLLAALQAEVNEVIDAEQAAITFINGAAARQQAAVEAAIANGATAEQLAPIQAEIDAMKAKSADLAAAIVANTPAE